MTAKNSVCNVVRLIIGCDFSWTKLITAITFPNSSVSTETQINKMLSKLRITLGEMTSYESGAMYTKVDRNEGYQAFGVIVETFLHVESLV